jgi:uncharacterized protein YdeI (YjbR/CyaY-like superfamily)
MTSGVGGVTIGSDGAKLLGMAADIHALTVPDAAAWGRWLEENEGQREGVWLTLAKKGTTKPTSLTYEQALAEAICCGWIDGQLGAGADGTYLRRFTPRRAGSAWSKRNVALATKLIEEGRIRPSGLAAVSRAQADGTWQSAYEGQARIEIPADLAAALAVDPAAKSWFDKLSASNRYAILYRVTTAKRAETRQRRIDQLVAMLAHGETIHPQRQPTLGGTPE